MKTILILLIGLSTFVLAQETFYLNLSTLGTNAALIEVSETFPTVIEFETDISEIYPLREERIAYDPSGSRVWLSAKVGRGEGGMTLIVDGQTAMFKVSINPDMAGPRRYVVTTPRSPEPRAVASLDVASRPRNVIPERELVDVPYVFESELTLSPEGPVISYELLNTGGYVLSNDIKQLRIFEDGELVDAGELNYSRDDSDGLINRITADQGERGEILLPTGVSGIIELEWRLIEIGTGRFFTVTGSYGL